MATSYTSLLGLALPVTGELSGTWGDTVNNYITNYLDAAVAGVQIISGSQTAVTLSVTNGSSLVQVGAGATGSAQYGIIRCSGNPASLLTITAPAASKSYLIINATSTSQSVKIVGTGPTTGVTLVSGESAVVAWNGTDFIKVSSSAVDGVSTFSAGTTGFTPSSATSGAVTLAGTLGIANGGTGITSFGTGVQTALGQNVTGSGGIVLATSPTLVTPALGTPSSGVVTNLTGTASININGTVGATTPSTVAATTLTTSSTVTHNGGTANGVAYLNGSKVLTTGSALTFDGSIFNLNAGTNARFYRGDNARFGFVFADNNGLNIGATSTSGEELRLSSTGSQIFFTGSTPTEAMRLTSTGLGIGTSSPGQKLDVNGDARVGNATAGTNRVLQINGVVNKASRIAFQESGTDRWLIGNGAASENGNFEIFDATTGNNFVMTRSGNLGLGVTPSAWQSDYRILQISTYGTFYGRIATNEVGMLQNIYRDSAGNFKFLQNGYGASYSFLSGGGHSWFNYGNNVSGVGAAASGTQAMTLDASGNLQLGTTGSAGRMHIAVPFSGSTATSLGDVSKSHLHLGDPGYNNQYCQITFGYDTTNAAAAIGYTSTDANGNTKGAIVFATRDVTTSTLPTERARITSSGNLLVGTTDDSTANKFVINGTMAFINGATIPQINYYSSASTIEYVNRNSGGAKTFSWYYGASGGGSPATLSTSGVWTNASDARGKENITDIHYGLDTVLALTPRQYDVKSDGSHAIGFVAQEVLPIVPELVHVTKRDEVNEFYGLDYGSMTAVLVKAIQELKAEFDAYKATHP